MRRFIAAMAMMLALCGLGVINSAGASAATGSGGCSIGGYNFVASIQTDSPHHFVWYHVGYLTSNPTGLEWRVRIWSGGGALDWDSGYITTNGNQNSQPIAVLSSGSTRVLMQVGRLGDGYPTCTALEIYGM